MEKIPTLFVRDDQDRKYVTREVNPGCEWVPDGEGTPTRKYDGTCVMYDPEDGGWWARREVKPGKAEPPNFRPVAHDDTTGKTVGWEPVEQSAFAKWHAQAIDGLAEQEPGTYELIGPKVNGNPEGEPTHRLVAHALADVMDVPDRSYDGIAAVLAASPGIEGIVFHHPDGRMVKIKRRDFCVGGRQRSRYTDPHCRGLRPELASPR